MRVTLLDTSTSSNMVKKSDDKKKSPVKKSAKKEPKQKDLEKSNTEVKSFMDDIDKDEENKVIEILKKYFIETSIHGLKYIFEGGRHISERIFWIIAELFLWIFCFYLIYAVCILDSI